MKWDTQIEFTSDNKLKLYKIDTSIVPTIHSFPQLAPSELDDILSMANPATIGAYMVLIDTGQRLACMNRIHQDSGIRDFRFGSALACDGDSHETGCAGDRGATRDSGVQIATWTTSYDHIWKMDRGTIDMGVD